MTGDQVEIDTLREKLSRARNDVIVACGYLEEVRLCSDELAFDWDGWDKKVRKFTSARIGD